MRCFLDVYRTPQPLSVRDFHLGARLVGPTVAE
jgi:hypothetical protein